MQVNYIPIKGLGVSCKFLDFLLPWKRTRCSVFWCYGTVLVRFWYGVVTPVSVWVCVHILHEILEDSIFLTWYVLILFFFDLILSEPGFFVSESRIM